MQIPEKLHNNITLAVAVLSLLIAAVSVYFQLERKKPELTVKVQSVDSLTPDNSISELTVVSTYKDVLIEKLWKVNILVQNSGERNLIGEGSQKSIIRSEIPLSFKEGIDILNIETSQGGPVTSILKVGNNKFEVSFSQWKKGEIVNIAFYLATSKSFHDGFTPKADVPVLIDGDLIIEGFQEKHDLSKNYLSFIPKQIGTPALVTSGIVNIVLGCYFLFFGVRYPYEIFKFIRWKSRNGEAFKKYVVEDPRFDMKQKQMYLRYPAKMPAIDWLQFPGERLSVFFSSFEVDSLSSKIGALTGAILGIFLGFGCLYLVVIAYFR